MAETIAAPSWGELDVLAELWKAGGKEMRLSDVHARVSARRRARGEAEPAISTVSTQLRTLLMKGMVKEVSARASSAGPLRPATRSPMTAYLAGKEPGEALREHFKALGAVYGEGRKMEAVLDFARAIGVGEKQTEEIRRIFGSFESDVRTD